MMEWLTGGIIITLLFNLATVAHYFGKISSKVDGMEGRLDRIENLIDRRWPGVGKT